MPASKLPPGRYVIGPFPEKYKQTLASLRLEEGFIELPENDIGPV